MCQPMPTGLYTRWDFDSETSRFTPQQNKARILRMWSYPVSNEQDQIVILKTSLQQADTIKLTALVLTAFVLLATLCLKLWVAFTISVFVKKYVPLLLKSIFNVVPRKDSSMH